MALDAADGPGHGTALDSHLSPALAPRPSTVLAQWLHRLGGQLLQAGPTEVLHPADQPGLAIGPLFAALAGIKELFCFQRAEAIGLTFAAGSAAGVSGGSDQWPSAWLY